MLVSRLVEKLQDFKSCLVRVLQNTTIGDHAQNQTENYTYFQ